VKEEKGVGAGEDVPSQAKGASVRKGTLGANILKRGLGSGRLRWNEKAAKEVGLKTSISGRKRTVNSEGMKETRK